MSYATAKKKLMERDYIIIDGRRCFLCRLCGQPMRPKGVKKRQFEFDHATGCPYCKGEPYLKEPR